MIRRFLRVQPAVFEQAEERVKIAGFELFQNLF